MTVSTSTSAYIPFSRRGSERKSRVRCAPRGKPPLPVCFVFRPRSPPRRILPFVSLSGDIFQIQPTVPRKHGISQIFRYAPSIPSDRVSIVQAVIHELSDLDRSTIYCPLNLARGLDPGEFRSFSWWRNGISTRLKEKKIFSRRGSASIRPSMDGTWVVTRANPSGSFYPTAKCWHTSRSTITRTSPPSHAGDIARFV